jgi:predicted alpha/beta superfamily hydrolase
MGDALVKEFIPELEKQYRCDGARFVRGHSSGGWAALCCKHSTLLFL